MHLLGLVFVDHSGFRFQQGRIERGEIGFLVGGGLHRFVGWQAARFY